MEEVKREISLNETKRQTTQNEGFEWPADTVTQRLFGQLHKCCSVSLNSLVWDSDCASPQRRRGDRFTSRFILGVTSSLFAHISFNVFYFSPQWWITEAMSTAHSSDFLLHLLIESLFQIECCSLLRMQQLLKVISDKCSASNVLFNWGWARVDTGSGY